MCLARTIGCPKTHFFPPRTRDLMVSHKTAQRHFFSTLYPLFPVIFATATVLAFVLLRSSRFNFICYIQCEAYSQIGPEVTLRPLATSCAKDYKEHSLAQTSFTEPPNRLDLLYQSLMLSVTDCRLDLTATSQTNLLKLDRV